MIKMGVYGTYVIGSLIKNREITQEKLNLSSPQSDVEASTKSEFQRIYLYPQDYEVDYAVNEFGNQASAYDDYGIMLTLSTSIMAINPMFIRWKLPEFEKIYFQVKMGHFAPNNNANNIYGIGLSDGTRNNRYYMLVCANGGSGYVNIGKVVNGEETIINSSTMTINRGYYYTHVFSWSKNTGKIITNRPSAADTAIWEFTDNSLKNLRYAEVFLYHNPTYGGIAKIIPPFQLLRY
jgi:hypothetical protein